MRTEVNSRIQTLPQARKKVFDQIVIGLGFAPNWLKEWRKFPGPRITLKTAQSELLYKFFFIHYYSVYLQIPNWKQSAFFLLNQ